MQLYDYQYHWLSITPYGEGSVHYYGDNVPPTRTYGRDQAVQIRFYAGNVDMSGKDDKYRFQAMFRIVDPTTTTTTTTTMPSVSSLHTPIVCLYCILFYAFCF